MTVVRIWLTCHRCSVTWADEPACWICSQPGEPTRHPILAPGSATQTFEERTTA